MPKLPSLGVAQARLPRLPRTGYRFERARQFGDVLLGIIGSAGLFTVAAVALGFVSSQYMIENPTRLTATVAGSWVTWNTAGRADADPYTRARFLRQGSLPLTFGFARTYEARYDSDGQRLHSSCEYGLTSNGVDGSWWSIVVFDERGRLIPNPAERYAYTSRTIARGPDGSFQVTLSRDARPGNWLPTGGAGRLVLHLSVVGYTSNPTTTDKVVEAGALPVIQRLACR
jgi:hypothetical protein